MLHALKTVYGTYDRLSNSKCTASLGTPSGTPGTIELILSIVFPCLRVAVQGTEEHIQRAVPLVRLSLPVSWSLVAFGRLED